jgi:hypothetical protein
MRLLLDIAIARYLILIRIHAQVWRYMRTISRAVSRVSIVAIVMIDPMYEYNRNAVHGPSRSAHTMEGQW